MLDRNFTVILIAPGFDLEQVAVWTVCLRRAGCPVALVGLTSGPQRSSAGVRLVPDADLDRPPGRKPGLVLLPGGREYAAALARDPRALRYLRAVLGANGRIGGERELEAALPELRFALVPPLPTDWRIVLDGLEEIRGRPGEGIGFPSRG
ncbi:MAG TPA: DJ-1/PfpI family protein [Anaerolineales bacterium]|nr:DJ-1/PfpI family protein [Anaerolineales bacterium]